MKKSIIFAALLMAGIAHAGGHWYAGVGLGQARADNMGDLEVAARLAEGAVDNTGTAWKVFAGYNMGKNFAIEGGYAKHGKLKASAETLLGVLTGRSETEAIFVDAVGKWPVSQNFGLFGKAGLAYADTEVNASLDDDPVIRDDNGKLTPKLGLGASYKFTKNVAVRAEYERYFNVGGNFTDVDGNRVRYKPGLDVWTIGLQVGF